MDAVFCGVLLQPGRFTFSADFDFTVFVFFFFSCFLHSAISSFFSYDKTSDNTC
jgi:hypothetical protein